MFNRKYIFKGSIFHCYVRLPECKPIIPCCRVLLLICNLFLGITISPVTFFLWPSGYLSNQENDRKRSWALKLMASWWLNQPVWKISISPIGSISQGNEGWNFNKSWKTLNFDGFFKSTFLPTPHRNRGKKWGENSHTTFAHLNTYLGHQQLHTTHVMLRSTAFFQALPLPAGPPRCLANSWGKKKVVATKHTVDGWNVWNPKNNGINYLSTGAGFQPSTVPWSSTLGAKWLRG